MDQRRLGGAVGRAQRHAEMAELGRDVDDAAAARAPHLGTANLHIRNAPVRLTPIAWFHCASVSVSTVPSGVTAAATFTSVVEPAERRDGARDRLLGARLARRRRPRSLARGRRWLFATVGRLRRIEVGDRDLRALGREPPRDRAADLAAAAGDQRHPPLQPARHQWVAACTKLPSKIADLGGNGFFMVPMSNSPSAILS